MRTVARSEGGARSPSLWRRSLTKKAAPDAKRETFLLPVALLRGSMKLHHNKKVGDAEIAAENRASAICCRRNTL
jgi:hypothetical protein